MESTRAEKGDLKCAEELETVFLRVLSVRDRTGLYYRQYGSESTKIANGMQYYFGRSNYD